MKPVVVFLVAFVVATAAATGAKVALTKPAARPAADAAHPDSAKADSSKAPAAKPDSARSATDTAVVASGQPATPPADTARPAPDSAKKPAAKDGPSAAQLEKTVSRAAVAAAAPDTAEQASERRIAKVFTSMDAKQAAKVLEHMTDGDVHIILGYVGVKQAAQILAALPPERVAKLSKLAMGTR